MNNPWIWALVAPTPDGIYVDKSSIQSVEGTTETGIDLYDPDDGHAPTFAGELEGYDGLTDGEIAYIFDDSDGNDDDDPDDEAPDVSRQIIAALEGEFSEMGAPLTPEERNAIRKARRKNKAKEARLLRELRNLRKNDHEKIQSMRKDFHQPGNQAHRPGHSGHRPHANKHGGTHPMPQHHHDGEWTTWMDTIRVAAASGAGGTAKGEVRVDFPEVILEDITIATSDTEALVKEIRIDKHRVVEVDNGVSVTNFGVTLMKRPEIKDAPAEKGSMIYATIEAGTNPSTVVITLLGKKRTGRSSCR